MCVHILVHLSEEDVTEIYYLEKLLTGNLKSVFSLRFEIPYFTEEYRNALISRPMQTSNKMALPCSGTQ
jgi:hypothetical protein